MTDNEKRSHDITLLFMDKLYDVSSRAEIATANFENRDSNFNFDFTKEYTRIYPIVLEAINKSFPHQ